MSDDHVTVTLSRNEALSVALMIRNRARREERRADKHPASARRLEERLALLGKFEDALGTTVQVWEDETWEDT